MDGQRRELRQPDLSPPESFNWAAQSRWECEVRSSAIITASMGVFHAYFKCTAILQGGYHCVLTLQTRKQVCRKDDKSPTAVPTAAAPAWESGGRALSHVGLLCCVLRSRGARTGLTSQGNYRQAERVQDRKLGAKEGEWRSWFIARRTAHLCRQKHRRGKN